MIKKELIPNILTIGRGVMTLVIVVLFYTNLEFRFQLILALFILAAVSDAFDGNLARLWKCESDFGKVFDSMLDKVLVLSMLMMLIPYHLLPTVVYVLFLIRELVVDSIKSFLTSKGRPIGAKMTGKLKMTVETIMIGVLVVRLFGDTSGWKLLSEGLAGVGLGLAYWSAGQYIWQWKKTIK